MLTQLVANCLPRRPHEEPGKAVAAQCLPLSGAAGRQPTSKEESWESSKLREPWHTPPQNAYEVFMHTLYLIVKI